MKNLTASVKKLFLFYFDGFRNMSVWGRKVWVVILVKLFIIFAILRLFFFHDLLHEKYKNDKQRSEYVIEQLTNTANNND